MVADDIDYQCGCLSNLLKSKNDRYGNSALEPLRIASDASADAGIRVRIDDKLSRIRNDPDNADTWRDLAGYIVLLFISNGWDMANPKSIPGIAKEKMILYEEAMP